MLNGNGNEYGKKINRFKLLNFASAAHLFCTFLCRCFLQGETF